MGKIPPGYSHLDKKSCKASQLYLTSIAEIKKEVDNLWYLSYEDLQETRH